MPLWHRQRSLHIVDGNDAIVMRATTSAWQWQNCYCYEGSNVIAMTAKMPGLQRCLHIEDGNTIMMMTTTTTPLPHTTQTIGAAASNPYYWGIGSNPNYQGKTLKQLCSVMCGRRDTQLTWHDHRMEPISNTTCCNCTTAVPFTLPIYLLALM